MCGSVACRNFDPRQWIKLLAHCSKSLRCALLNFGCMVFHWSSPSQDCCVTHECLADIYFSSSSSDSSSFVSLSLFQHKVVPSWGETDRPAHRNHQTWSSELKPLVGVSSCQTSALPAPPRPCPAALLPPLHPSVPPSGINSNAVTPSSQTQLNSPQESKLRLQALVPLAHSPLLEVNHLNPWSGEKISLAAGKTALSPCTSTAQTVTWCCPFLPALAPLPPPSPLSPWWHPLLSTSTMRRKSQRARDVFLTQTYLVWTTMSDGKKKTEKWRGWWATISQ